MWMTWIACYGQPFLQREKLGEIQPHLRLSLLRQERVMPRV